MSRESRDDKENLERRHRSPNPSFSESELQSRLIELLDEAREVGHALGRGANAKERSQRPEPGLFSALRESLFPAARQGDTTVILEAEEAGRPEPLAHQAVDPRNVMVVHGRDLALRDSMFAFLRALDLLPLEWSRLVSLTGQGSPYVGDILDHAFASAQAAVILLSPDDEAKLREPFCTEDPAESELRGQARPNVLFEAGLAFGRFPQRTILVQVGRVRPASDLAGRHVVRLVNDATSRHELANRLETAGCRVDRSGTDWLTVGSFVAST